MGSTQVYLVGVCLWRK